MATFLYKTLKLRKIGIADGSYSIDIPKLDLMIAAARVADPGILTGNRRPLAELLWRAFMVDASLTAVNRTSASDPDWQWNKSDAFTRLDPSEKTAVSYFLGMLQASVIAKAKLGVTDIVHVDAVLELRKYALSQGRPDLVGYRSRPKTEHSPGRILIEAKGRTNGSDAAALRKAKSQVEDPKTVARKLVGANPLLVASMAYFTGGGAWRGIIEDPPAEDEVEPLIEDDSEFRGLVNIASLRPVVDAIAQLRDYAPERVQEVRATGMTVATLPDRDLVLGVPEQLFNRVIELTGPPDNPRPVTEGQARQWAAGIDANRQGTPELRAVVGKVHSDEYTDFRLDQDGVFIAERRTNDEPEPAPGLNRD